MRLPSLPGQVILGDRGENLSSVLQAIAEQPEKKRALMEWLRQLTPLDVTDFDFVPDQTGRILVTLLEADGQRTSVYSASDGTLRFLAMVAAMLGPDPARFYFFEELDNGIHPTRLHLLLQLIEQSVAGGRIQMVATTHSPQLLGFLSEQGREAASLVYRLPQQPDARIKKILEIPEARRVLQNRTLARLHESGWLENAVAFLEAPEEVAEVAQ
jgi:predicted ATPase